MTLLVPPPAGAWLAYYPDGSSFAVFGEEIDALRYALPRAQSVVFARYGETIAEAEARDEAERRAAASS